MHKASTKGFWKCLAACTAVCGPIFIADTATGGAALASGSSAGLK